ncbi:MAG TPA: hypothetical protein VKA26_03995 [Ignavibacteriaceae bacterium]|nr:hypothetical protein [Ignavibacteriaceae bacterium]
MFSNKQFYEITFQYLYQTRIHKILKLYNGAGPFINYNFSKYELQRKYYENDPNDNYSTYSKNNSSTLSVGLSIVLGLEGNVYKNISLFTEYEATVSRG